MILFERVRFKNFGSFGNTFTEIILNKRRTTLVSGSNGNGKSFALLDSITYALFGKPFRKINIPQLINTVNEKDCVVEIEFSIGEIKYKIIRGLNPKKFQIFKNDEMINQHAESKDYQKMLEEQILKMNYKTFTQVVILGSSSFVPFMQLPAADRRAIIEDILDIQIFGLMNTLLKEKIIAEKEKLKDIKYALELALEKIRIQEDNIESIKKKAKISIEKNDEEILASEKHLTEEHEVLEQVKLKLEEMESNVSDKEDIQTKHSKIEKLLDRILANIQSTENEISFYETNKNCPTCKQELHQDFIQQEVVGKQEKKKSFAAALLDLQQQESEIGIRLSEIAKTTKQINELCKKTHEVLASTISIKKYIDKIKNNTKHAESYDEDLRLAEEALAALRCDHATSVEEKERLQTLLHRYEVCSFLLKDHGIKSKILAHYLPIMNKLINKFLSSMDFFVQFILDENFNETIKSRHRDAFTYMSFSEGEKLRIDLSLLLAWREIARIKNSANCNLLILDEVFDSSLDAAGTEEFLKLLGGFGKNANIFVISHKADQLIDKFDGAISFEKNNNFSRLVT